MARDVVTRLVCDLCADATDAVDTVQFAFDGRALRELDLCGEHLDEFRTTADVWLAESRLAGRSRAGSGAAPRRKADRDRLRMIRAWARENGFPTLAARGRLPNDVYEAYERATSA